MPFQTLAAWVGCADAASGAAAFLLSYRNASNVSTIPASNILVFMRRSFCRSGCLSGQSCKQKSRQLDLRRFAGGQANMAEQLRCSPLALRHGLSTVLL